MGWVNPTPNRYLNLRWNPTSPLVGRGTHQRELQEGPNQWSRT